MKFLAEKIPCLPDCGALNTIRTGRYGNNHKVQGFYKETYFISTSEEKTDTAKTDKKTAAATSGEYTVVAGDSLSRIAGSLLGDRTKWKMIFDMNVDKIRDPNLICPGQVIKIP